MYLCLYIAVWSILQYLRLPWVSISIQILPEEDRSSSHVGPTATTATTAGNRSRSHRPFSEFDTDTLDAVRRMSTTKNPLRQDTTSMHSMCYIRRGMHSARQLPASRAQEGISQVAAEKDRGAREPAAREAGVISNTDLPDRGQRQQHRHQ